MQRALIAVLLAALAPATASCFCKCPKPNVCPYDPAPAVKLGTPKPVTGVFLTLGEDIDYTKLCGDGITTIIVHSVEASESKAKKLLDAAPEACQIYLGLHHDASFSPGESSLSDALAADMAIIDAVSAWPNVDRIAGWYVSQEIYNFRLGSLDDTWKRGAAIRDEYLIPLTKRLTKPVLISPYFHPTKSAALLGAADTAKLFHTIFHGSGIHTVLLQDSIGARNDPGRIGCCTWSRAEFEKQMVRYERAVQQALKNTGVRFGVNVESFEFEKCDEVDAPKDAFERQLQLIPDGVEMVVSFSYDHLKAVYPSP